MQRLVSILAAAALAATASAQFSLVIPNGMAAAEGSTSNAFPWGRGGAGIRIQTIYDSSHFTAQGVTYPIIITGLRWRMNGTSTTVASTQSTGSTVQLSTCPVDQAAVTTSHAANRGADLTTCFTGVVSWAAQAALPGPCPFLISTPFSTNFIYDPSLGDLNIETDIPIQTFTGTAVQLDVHATAPLASRVYLTTGYPTGTPVVNLNHGVVVEVDYVPAAGLYASFTANVTSGASPLAVNFTDSSYTSDPGGITGWAWDFDGDSIIDSNLQNPSFVYTGCGDYNVSLTVTDGTHAPNTITRTAYVKTDEITAGFTFALFSAPNIFQFTDTTTPAATAWDWDFNGDNITDSTVQNPVWPMNLCASQVVRLTATRSCRTSTKSQTVFLSPANLSTLYAANNGGSTGWICLIDVQVTNPSGINICGLDHNTGTTLVGTPFTANVYVTDGTYVGKDNNIAPWRLVGTGAGTAQGNDQHSTTPLASPIYLPPGNYGLAIQLVGASVRYTGTASGGSQVPYSNSDLTILVGAVRSTLFANGTFFTIRQWNGTIHYDTANLSATAGYGWFAPGCAGSMGITHLQHTNRPQLGTTLNVNLDNLPLSAAILMIGFSNTTSGFGPLPLDLTAFNAPGCYGRVSPDATVLLFGAGNAASWGFSVPNNGGLISLRLFNQALVLDPAANGLGAVTSDATGMMIGN